MEALRNALGAQKKRRLTREGAPVGNRRSTTSPPPDSGEASTQVGNLLTLRPNEPIPYPFNAQLRLDADMKIREKKLRNFVVLTPIFPDLEFFYKCVPIHRELKAYFVTNGLGFVYGDNPGVFEKVVREFAYSFKPRWGIAEIGEDSARFVKEWTFRLGGRDFTMGSEDLRSAFGLDNREVCIPVSRSSMNELWRLITKSERDYRSGCKATQIKVPMWKFIHRLIATCIYLRKDGGRFVNSDDLELMTCLYGSVEFDPLCCITKALQEPNLPNFRGHYISGGHFVSMIARFVGFSLNPSKALPLSVLGEIELLHRGLIKRIKVNGCWVIRLADEEDEENDGEELPEAASPPRPSFHQEHGEPSTTHHGPSDYDEVLRRLDSLSTSTREIATWQNDMGAWQTSMASWQGDMMRGLYTNLGYPGYTSPPRPSFHYGYAHDMPPTDTSPPRPSFHHGFTQDTPHMDTTPRYDDFTPNEGMEPTFARDNENWDEDEATTSEQSENPNKYRMVYRRRNR